MLLLDEESRRLSPAQGWNVGGRTERQQNGTPGFSQPRTLSNAADGV